MKPRLTVIRTAEAMPSVEFDSYRFERVSEQNRASALRIVVACVVGALATALLVVVRAVLRRAGWFGSL